nr:transposase [Hymenobacter nivis]
MDDSILEKAHTDPSALICTHWDHSQGRFVKGLNFVSLLYQAGALALPIAVELIEKTEAVWDAKAQKTKAKSKFIKNEYLRAMLRMAQRQVAEAYLLADSWYASAENLNAVLELGHGFVMALESSRTVALSEGARAQGQFHAVDTPAFPAEQPLRVFLRSVEPAVLVSRQVFINKDGSHGVLYLVSSDTSLNQVQWTTIYQRRWKVEEYHKSLKQNASMGKSPTKKPDTQANHFFAAILAYSKLEALKVRHGIGHFRLKAQLYLAGLKAMNQELAQFAA